jgi:serine/threonine-protein kinase HipA
MKFEPVKVVHVYYKPMSDKIFVGRLALKDRKIFFEYDSSFIEAGLNLSPFKLPLKSGVITSNDFVFDGLFGVFNDSLPDGWGRLLLDRALIKHNINPGALSMLDRLCFVGSHGMGALIYEPKVERSPCLSRNSLDEIAAEIAEFQEHDDDKYIEDLLTLGGSSAGARPKVLMHLDNEHWLIKFPSSTDPKDIGAIEYAYHQMAKDAGLDVPQAKLFPSRQGLGFFGSIRFDKTDVARVHMHTISGLLHVDHRTPSLDYEMIMKATRHLTLNMRECEKQYRVCVFNILSHNRDDHAKNFSFLMDPNGVWQISPSYDLTFSSGPSAEHCSMVMGEGKAPGMAELLELAKITDITKSAALKIIDEVELAVNKWPQFAKDAGVSNASLKLIQSAITKISKENF